MWYVCFCTENEAEKGEDPGVFYQMKILMLQMPPLPPHSPMLTRSIFYFIDPIYYELMTTESII